MTTHLHPGLLLFFMYFCHEISDCDCLRTEDNIFTEGTELVFAFIVHRHGDKTPDAISMEYAVNRDELEKYIRLLGYGQLTNVGKRRGYDLGRYIRRRYNKLISRTYNGTQMYIRTTDFDRVKMTCLTAMAAVYPALGDNWSDVVDWVPIPYTTVPEKYDFNLALLNCPVYISAFDEISTKPTDNGHTNMLKKISKVLNQTIVNTPGNIFDLNDVIQTEISLGIDLGPEIYEVLPELSKAADEAVDTLFGDNNKYNNLKAGVLLQQFFESASGVIAGNETHTVKIYSGHDFNVYSFETVTRVTPRQGAPRFGALIALELRRVISTGEYVVLPLYLPSPEERGIYLTVKGCGIPCNYNKFYNITSKYILTEDEWRMKCHFNNMVIDDYGLQ